MVETTLHESQVKELFKQATIELLEDRRDLVHDLVAGVIEDLALLRAIREGESRSRVSRRQVLRLRECAA